MRSLRSRLVALVLILLTTVSLVVGVVTVLALRDFLVGRVDQQLDELAPRIGPPEVLGDGPVRQSYLPRLPRLTETIPGVPGFLTGPGVPPGALGMTSETAAVVRPGEPPRPLTAAERAALARSRAGAVPRTVRVAGLGDYRVVRVPSTPDAVVGLPLGDVDATITRLAGLFGAIAFTGLALAGLAGTLLVRRSLRPLRRVAGVATHVSELPLSDGEVDLAERVPDTDPRTEVGQVGAALNRMLSHIETALTARYESEQRVRRFVADASHELRTPLAAIRGYAEVAHRGAEPMPPDVAFALSRVESQADRMGDLVDDLLLLARLDSGRPLERVETDLSRLVVDAVQDAHVAGPSHAWGLAMPPSPVLVPGDPLRLHQVVGNLLTNARVHTPSGTTVRIGLARQGSSAVLTIEDDGPGIPPDLLPEIFERFARGDGSRSRREHGSGTGLGLAIVHAVVSAHAGEVGAESAPGRTTFTVTLPGLLEKRTLTAGS